MKIETKLDCFMLLMIKKIQCGETDASVHPFVATLVFPLDIVGIKLLFTLRKAMTRKRRRRDEEYFDTKRCQFHQHFTRNCFTDILLPESYKAKL